MKIWIRISKREQILPKIDMIFVGQICGQGPTHLDTLSLCIQASFALFHHHCTYLFYVPDQSPNYPVVDGGSGSQLWVSRFPKKNWSQLELQSELPNHIIDDIILYQIISLLYPASSS